MRPKQGGQRCPRKRGRRSCARSLWLGQRNMRSIPQKLKREILADPFYKQCARLNNDCAGRITWEHAIIYAGRQLNEKWSIVPLCTYHHAVDKHQDGGDLRKGINVWIALNRASDSELINISKVVDYLKMREQLNGLYGKPKVL